jgi:probable rRNA maturation factor
MSHEIDVTVEDGVEVDTDRVEALLDALLEAADLGPSMLSVVFTDDARIRLLNRTWRGKDEATDVLSFPQQEGLVRGGLLGDLVVSVETAAAQAASLGHGTADEIKILLVHGLCHLLGHDHHEPGEAARMASAEAALLGRLGGIALDRALIARSGVLDAG